MRSWGRQELSYVSQSTWTGLSDLAHIFVRSRVVEWFLTESLEPKEQLAYYYCSNPMVGSRKCLPGFVFRSFLRQLAWTSTTKIFDGITEAMSGPDGDDLSDNQCQQLLGSRIDQLERVILIIDGVDHCAQPEALLLALKRLYEEYCGKLWVFLTSRVHIPVKRTSLFPECTVIDLPSPTQPTDDVKFFIANEMFGGIDNAPGGTNRQDLSEEQKDKLLLSGKNEGLEQMVFDALCVHTKGM